MYVIISLDHFPIVFPVFYSFWAYFPFVLKYVSLCQRLLVSRLLVCRARFSVKFVFLFVFLFWLSFSQMHCNLTSKQLVLFVNQLLRQAQFHLISVCKHKHKKHREISTSTRKSLCIKLMLIT